MGRDFEAGIKSDFQKFAPTGHSVFSEDYSTFLHRQLYQLGPCAVHDQPLFDERARRELRLQVEVFDKVPFMRQMALSVPMEQGETLLIFGYSEKDVPEYGTPRHSCLELVLPAFEHAVRLRKTQGAHNSLLEAFDSFSSPMMVTDGQNEWANKSFDVLSRRLKSHMELRTIARSIASMLLDSSSERTAHFQSQFQGEFQGQFQGQFQGAYSCAIPCGSSLLRLTARLSHAGERTRAIIQLDDVIHLPPFDVVRRKVGLTRKEYEIAELVVLRLSDKEIAASQANSVHTVRQHVATILAKAGTSRARLAETLWGWGF